MFFRVCLQAMLVLVPPILCFSFPRCVSAGGSEACFLGALPTICLAGHGCCRVEVLGKNTMDKNSDPFAAAVLGLLFVGRHGPRLRASIVGSLEKAAAVDVLLG